MTRRTPAQYDWTNALFNDRRLTKHFTSPRRSRISHVTLHHMTIVSSGTDASNSAALEGCYKTWQTREASANYGVAGDQVWQFVSDNDAPWSDANSTSNHSTLSIEHANSTAGPGWQIADETMATGQRLVATLHRLYGLGRPSRKTVKVHRDFYATSCPGPYMMAHLDAYIAAAAKFYDGDKPDHKPPVPPKPVAASKPHEYISCNLAGNDTVGKGKRTRVARSKKDIPNYLAPKKPTWFHFQECYDDMLPGLDKGFSEYARVPAGGRGRESYYRKDAGITILEAKLLNVKHADPKKDTTKEHLVVAWRDADGFEGVYVNFHNSPPSDGTKYQPLQLLDCVADGTAMCDRHDIPRTNLVVTGDGNMPDAAEFVKSKGWRESIDIAKKPIDLIYTTLNGWLMRLTAGKRIDVDVFLPGALVDEAELLFGAVISDHWAHRVLHRLIK